MSRTHCCPCETCENSGEDQSGKTVRKRRAISMPIGRANFDLLPLILGGLKKKKVTFGTKGTSEGEKKVSPATAGEVNAYLFLLNCG